eukprot:TRINITY_DN72431_c0_g1_i1.p1 TRINITY_DN72431_c0_g1~~TRINITY_DN72431_c0_g1_i1.p1  ORF type:complete len:390 (+),score=95.55 TRINITY_DN72431_c0_g1_i1:57-1226(+)
MVGAFRKLAVASGIVGAGADLSAHGLVLLQLKAEANNSAPSTISRSGRRNSLPPLPGAFPADAMNKCDSDKLADWQGRMDTTAKLIEVWQAKTKGAAVISEGSETNCLAAGNRPSGCGRASQVMTLVDEPEAEMCKVKPRGRTTEQGEFTVTGTLAKTQSTRKYEIMWPKKGTCTSKSPCPVVMFFHGCGSMVIPVMMAEADDACYDTLKSVIVVPKLEKEEKWTEKGTTVLDDFVLPLWNELKEKHSGLLDDNRVAAVGASMGSGMAMQAGLLHPELFSTVVAAGLADGSHCEDGPNNEVKFEVDAILGSNKVPTGKSKLKGIVMIMSELEKNLDTRLGSTLDMLETSGVSNRVDLHMRLYGDTGHAKGILYTFNQWATMQSAIFNGF